MNDSLSFSADDVVRSVKHVHFFLYARCSWRVWKRNHVFAIQGENVEKILVTVTSTIRLTFELK